MNPNPRLSPPPRANKFETVILVVLFALTLLFIGAVLDVFFRLIAAGWRAADFIFNLFANHV